MRHTTTLRPFCEMPAPPFGGADDWMAGGSCDHEAHAAYGFTEAQVVDAVTGAYMEAFMDNPRADRDALRAAFVGAFVDALERLGRPKR